MLVLKFWNARMFCGHILRYSIAND
jgi:hypothetical protein